MGLVGTGYSILYRLSRNYYIILEINIDFSLKQNDGVVKKKDGAVAK